MPNDKFKYEDATVVIREKRGSDELDSPWVLHDLLERIKAENNISTEEVSNLIWSRIAWFVDILVRSEVTGDLGFPWPDYMTATVEEVYEAYQALMSGPPELVKAWKHASRRANLEIVDPED